MKRDSNRACFALFFGFFLLGAVRLYAAPPPFQSGMPPIKESRAYKTFLMRPYSELSKIVFLTDRFKEAKIKVIYDGLHFEPEFAVRIAKWFLSQHYRKESAKEWIMVYCNQSLFEHQLIWAMDKKGDFKLSREVLMTELKALEETCEQDLNCKGKKKPSA
ncbi:MAG: hypothetical protein EXS63_02795 [Candidatus Omnitrophica bacterium]|nr:hypothetical protein [Candidatus Omnitrophota bacterium]